MIVLDNVKTYRTTYLDGDYFFGYYDISPESYDGSKILVCRAPFIDHMPSSADKLEIGFLERDDCTDKSTGEGYVFNIIDSTSSWNFQEGCRLQWLDNHRIIYNNRDLHESKNGFCAVIYDFSSNTFKKLSHPIYSINPDRKMAISFSFTDNKYFYAADSCTEKDLMLDSGICLIDLDDGSAKNIISLEKVVEEAGSVGLYNWFESAYFAPDGKHFYFYHRYQDNLGYEFTRLLVSDMEGNYKCLFNNQFLSHCSWCGNKDIVGWGRLPGGLNSLYKSNLLRDSGVLKVMIGIYHKVIKNPGSRQRFTNDGYIDFNVTDGKTRKFDNSDLNQDGHCTWSNDLRYMLTDTYADAEGYRSLLLYDVVLDNVIVIGRYYAVPKAENIGIEWISSPMRCDLHPKWSYDNKRIYFDSVHEGKRGLYFVNMDEVLGKYMKKI